MQANASIAARFRPQTPRVELQTRKARRGRATKERLQDVETQLRDNKRRYQSDALVIEKSIAAVTEKLWDRLLVYFKNREKDWVEYLKACAPYIASAASIIYKILTRMNVHKRADAFFI